MKSFLLGLLCGILAFGGYIIWALKDRNDPSHHIYTQNQQAHDIGH
jgi:hypothetical protein